MKAIEHALRARKEELEERAWQDRPPLKLTARERDAAGMMQFAAVLGAHLRHPIPNAWFVAITLAKIDAKARALRRRFVAESSHVWATLPEYQDRTARETGHVVGMVAQLSAHVGPGANLRLEINSDGRGPAVKLTATPPDSPSLSIVLFC